MLFDRVERGGERKTMKKEGKLYEFLSRKNVSKNIFVISMLIIPICSWLLFWLYVNIDMIFLAFQDTAGKFTLDNFKYFWRELTEPGGTIGIALRNTLLYFVINVFLLMPSGTLIAYFLFKKIRWYKFLRFMLFLPGMIPGMVMIASFKEFIKPWGPIAALGVKLPDSGLLANEKTATATVMLYVIWTGLAGGMLLMNGAMTRIPTSVFEAAKLDGCGTWKEFIHLVIPLIMPTLSMQMIFACTGLFAASGPILLMTGGAYGTTTLSYWIFITTVQGSTASGAYNIVSATGLVFTCVALPLILLVKFLSEKIEAVEY